MGFQLPLPTSLNWCNRVYAKFPTCFELRTGRSSKGRGASMGACWSSFGTQWTPCDETLQGHESTSHQTGKKEIIDSKVALGGICDRSQEGIALYFRPANLELTTFSWLFLNRPKEQRNASFCWYVDRTHWYVRSVGTEKHHWFEGLLPQEITSKNDAREMSPPLKYGWNRS